MICVSLVLPTSPTLASARTHPQTHSTACDPNTHLQGSRNALSHTLSLSPSFSLTPFVPPSKKSSKKFKLEKTSRTSTVSVGLRVSVGPRCNSLHNSTIHLVVSRLVKCFDHSTPSLTHIDKNPQAPRIWGNFAQLRQVWNSSENTSTRRLNPFGMAFGPQCWEFKLGQWNWREREI